MLTDIQANEHTIIICRPKLKFCYMFILIDKFAISCRQTYFIIKTHVRLGPHETQTYKVLSMHNIQPPI